VAPPRRRRPPALPPLPTALTAAVLAVLGSVVVLFERVPAAPPGAWVLQLLWAKKHEAEFVPFALSLTLAPLLTVLLLWRGGWPARAVLAGAWGGYLAVLATRHADRAAVMVRVIGWKLGI